MRTFRGLLSSLGAGLSLIIAGMLALLVVSSVVAFRGVPGMADAAPAGEVVVAAPAPSDTDPRQFGVPFGSDALRDITAPRSSRAARRAMRRLRVRARSGAGRATTVAGRRRGSVQPIRRTGPGATPPAAAGSRPSTAAGGSPIRVPHVDGVPQADPVIDAVNGAVDQVTATTPRVNVGETPVPVVTERAGGTAGRVQETTEAAANAVETTVTGVVEDGAGRVADRLAPRAVPDAPPLRLP